MCECMEEGGYRTCVCQGPPPDPEPTPILDTWGPSDDLDVDTTRLYEAELEALDAEESWERMDEELYGI